MPLEFQPWITRSDLRERPHVLFIFGDNEQRRGWGGQAKEMRGESNAVGIRVKHLPFLNDQAFWSDTSYEKNCQMIDEDLLPVIKHLQAGGIVVIPSDGIGTGLARLTEVAPQTFDYLQKRLSELQAYQ